MIKTLVAGLFTVLLCLGPVRDASAQESTTQGWVFGLDFGGTTASFGKEPSDTGGQYGLWVGYGLNKILTLYLGASEAEVDIQEFDELAHATYVGHADLGVRLHLANSRRPWVPYGDLAFTRLVLEGVLDTGEQLSGAAFSLGGGLAVYPSKAWALDVGFRWSTGEFKSAGVGNISAGGLDIDAESAQLTVGVAWWP